MYWRVLLIPVQIKQDFDQLYEDKEDLTIIWPQQAGALVNILKAKGAIKEEEHADG